MRSSVSADDDVRSLETCDLDGLRKIWTARFGPPPKLRSVELLRLMLAWRIQARASGGLDHATRRALERQKPAQAEGRNLGLGAILRRTWQGREIEVVVEAEGLRFNGQLYPSLSAIAEAATGTRWNGPRFFGLRKTAS